MLFLLTNRSLIFIPSTIYEKKEKRDQALWLKDTFLKETAANLSKPWAY